MSIINLTDCHEKETNPGFKGRFVHAAHMTSAHWSISEGASSPEHTHAHEQFVIVFEGKFALTIAGKTSILTPGTVAIVSSNVPHYAKAITYCRVIDVFCPVREDLR